MQSYTHFTLTERESLRILLEQGKSMREIAQQLDRHVSSISREVKRNGNKDGSYNAWRGCSLYIHRRKKSVRKTRLETDEGLRLYVLKCLSKYWPPETIVAKYKEKNPGVKLSYCTIYRAIQAGQLPDYPARQYLRRGKRNKNKQDKIRAIHPHRKIEERPQVANDRQRIGDWEGDTVHGAQGKGCLVTMIDRKTRYLCAEISPNFSAKTVAQKLVNALKEKPVFSLTLDQGSEFADFKNIERRIGANIYFCDTHSPWQRGSNENINGLLRFWYPKGTDFLQVSQNQLDSVLELINSRPRKCLGWLSPKDIFFNKCCT